jgi:hypothetical protein
MNLQKIYAKKHKITWLILTHASRIPNKIFRVQTGRVPSWTYSRADVYRGTTVLVNRYSPSRSGQSPNKMVNWMSLYFPKYLPLLSWVYRHLFSKFQVFFSSVFGVFWRRNFSAQVLLLWQFPTLELSYKLQLLYFDNYALHFIITSTLITNKLLVFNRIWILSSYGRKMLLIDNSRMASKVIFMNTDFQIFHIFRKFRNRAVINFKNSSLTLFILVRQTS